MFDPREQFIVMHCATDSAYSADLCCLHGSRRRGRRHVETSCLVCRKKRERARHHDTLNGLGSATFHAPTIHLRPPSPTRLGRGGFGVERRRFVPGTLLASSGGTTVRRESVGLDSTVASRKCIRPAAKSSGQRMSATCWFCLQLSTSHDSR